MSDKRYTRRKTTNYGNFNGELTPSKTSSSGLNRINSLKYTNLSPVRSYYNRRFGKTDEFSRKPKQNEDKEKTPVPSGLSTTISRLENKYSDILTRYGRKKEVKEDREKTLEPPERKYLPLAKSKTSIFGNSSGSLASIQKEKTPYRNKYLDYHEYKPRTELPDRKKYLSRLENDATTTRNKDSIYDSPLYHRSKYEDIPTKNDYKFYNGKDENNNHYKSKYDPDSLYSELRRPNHDYRRSEKSSDKRFTSNYQLCPIDYDESVPSTSSGISRTSGLKRSQTQKFFDFENLNIDEDSTIVSAREARRKEVRELIQKYAPKSDDKSSDDDEDVVEIKDVKPKIDERRPLLQHQNSIKALQTLPTPVNQLDSLLDFSAYKARIPNVYPSFVRFVFVIYWNLTFF